MFENSLTVGTMYRGSAKLVDRAPMLTAVIFMAFCLIDAVSRQSESFDQFWLRFAIFAAAFVAYTGAYYALHHVLLERIGLRTTSHGVIDFAGLSIFIGVGVTIGAFLFIVPGLVLLCGWFVALPYLLSHEDSILDAPARSWDMTTGYKVEIFFSTLLSLVPMIVLSLLELLIGFHSEFLDVIAGAMVTMLNVLLTIAALAILLGQNREPDVED